MVEAEKLQPVGYDATNSARWSTAGGSEAWWATLAKAGGGRIDSPAWPRPNEGHTADTDRRRKGTCWHLGDGC